MSNFAVYFLLIVSVGLLGLMLLRKHSLKPIQVEVLSTRHVPIEETDIHSSVTLIRSRV